LTSPFPFVDDVDRPPPDVAEVPGDVVGTVVAASGLDSGGGGCGGGASSGFAADTTFKPFVSDPATTVPGPLNHTRSLITWTAKAFPAIPSDTRTGDCDPAASTTTASPVVRSGT
jgi:hypothetical protein